jgi:hypothetical protein
VRHAAREGHTTAETLVCRLGLDDPRCCGRYRRNVERFVLLALAESTLPVVDAAG